MTTRYHFGTRGHGEPPHTCHFDKQGRPQRDFRADTRPPWSTEPERRHFGSLMDGQASTRSPLREQGRPGATSAPKPGGCDHATSRRQRSDHFGAHRYNRDTKSTTSGQGILARPIRDFPT